jgi:uncharacterized membrane protein YfcA
MGLILEIGLTIAAWRNGWKGRALLPLGIGMGIAFFIGLAVGASGGTLEPVGPLLILLDLAAIGVLLWMVSNRPTEGTVRETPKEAPPMDVPSTAVVALPDPVPPVKDIAA